MLPSLGAFADAVIVAAGSSSRMGGQDKSRASIGGRPALQWAVEAMRGASVVRRVIVVTAPERLADLQAEPWIGAADVTLVAGGDRRQDSVASGVRAAGSAVVLVHDAARPLATSGLADRVAHAAAMHGAAIPVLPVVDSLKRVTDGLVTDAPDRSTLFRAQTPQGARRELLMAAIDAFADGPDMFRDEQELLARQGVPVVTVPGEPGALKITEPADLDYVRALARDRTVGHDAPAPDRSTGVAPGRAMSYGWGSDSHPFGSLDGLRLAGLEIPEAPRLHGHSDGDVALHAVSDGLLAAARMGDLGRLFPDTDAATRGIDSRELLRAVVTRLGAAGLAPASLDLTIVGARPRLGGARLERMRGILADLLGIDPATVAVQASTGNLSGDEGAGRTISAQALVGVLPA
jgi:2-C-methyl-D-erythritol 4-phosphate cytidylyltransferase / 2-C-methyl-D-erythritol 2,4-cyclodiphosphate synthase